MHDKNYTTFFNSVIINVKVPQQQQNVYTVCCGYLYDLDTMRIYFLQWPTNNKILLNNCAKNVGIPQFSYV